MSAGAYEVRLDVLGQSTVLHVQDPRLRDVTTGLLADLVVRSPAPTPPAVATRVQSRGFGPWQVRSPGHDATSVTLDGAVADVLTAVNLTGVLATPTLAVHAAVVGHDGLTVVLPGASGVGKSTLTAALLRRGWRYGSDEAWAMTWRDGTGIGYPRPMSLSAWSAAAVGVTGVVAAGEHVVRANDLGADILTPIPTPTDVVLPERHDGPPTVTPIHAAEAVVALLQRSFTHHREPARALDLLARACRRARCWRLLVGEPHASARELELVVHRP